MYADGTGSANGSEIEPSFGDQIIDFSTATFTSNGSFWDNSTENTSLYYYYYYNEDEVHYSLQTYPFEIYVLGYALPVMIILTTLSNIIVAGFFLTRKDRGKATNLLFVSIAFSDTMTGITLLPNSIGVYAENHTDMTTEWCNMYMTLRFYVSPVFHTVSVWQTVVLCIQRYLCVCHPFISGRLCTFWKTFVSIVVIYVFAVVLHVYHLVDNKIGHFSCRWKIETPCKESCMYLWFSVVLQHLLPCVLLVILTIITILKLGKAQRRVSSMAHMTHRKHSNRSTRDKIITYTAAFIVLFFLIPELPHGVYKLVFLAFKHAKNQGFTAFQNHIIISVYEIILTASFCANFWIYCCMMRDFRRKLLKFLTCGRFKLGFARLRSFSVSSKVGSALTTLSRSSSNVSRNRIFSGTSLHSTVSENLHAVIPMTPTRGYDQINFLELTNLRDKDGENNLNSSEQKTLKDKIEDINDDVFVN